MHEHDLNAAERALMNQILAEMEVDPEYVGGELLRARRIICLLATTTMEMPPVKLIEELRHALNEYTSYMQPPSTGQPAQ